MQLPQSFDQQLCMYSAVSVRLSRWGEVDCEDDKLLPNIAVGYFDLPVVRVV
jgi:hypothetical protein